MAAVTRQDSAGRSSQILDSQYANGIILDRKENREGKAF